MEETIEEKKEENVNRLQIRCINCGKSLGYYRIRTKEWVCRICGQVNKEVFRDGN